VVSPPDRDERHPADEATWTGRPAGGAGRGDLIELGGLPAAWPWRGLRATTIGVAAVALVAGLLLGFAAGHLTASPKRGPARPVSSTSAAAPPSEVSAIFYTGNRCAVQHGRTLQLGIEIDNRSGHTITVDRIKSALPLGGLRQIGSELATCGSLQVPGGVPLTTIADGASAWLTMTFAVQVRCPAPAPVLFVISYAIAGKVSSMYFDGFPDLGTVPYTGCRGRRVAVVTG